MAKTISTGGNLALFWLMSDRGFYFGLPAMGIDAKYNESPISIVVFHLFWSGLAAIAFWPL